MIVLVIPNRTKRWFHQWKKFDMEDTFPAPTYNMFCNTGGKSFGSWSAVPGVSEHFAVSICEHGNVPVCCEQCDAEYARRLTGLDEQIGVSIPMTSGSYLGLSRNWHPRSVQ